MRAAPFFLLIILIIALGFSQPFYNSYAMEYEWDDGLAELWESAGYPNEGSETETNSDWMEPAPEDFQYISTSTDLDPPEEPEADKTFIKFEPGRFDVCQEVRRAMAYRKDKNGKWLLTLVLDNGTILDFDMESGREIRRSVAFVKIDKKPFASDSHLPPKVAVDSNTGMIAIGAREQRELVTDLVVMRPSGITRDSLKIIHPTTHNVMSDIPTKSDSLKDVVRQVFFLSSNRVATTHYGQPTIRVWDISHPKAKLVAVSKALSSKEHDITIRGIDTINGKVLFNGTDSLSLFWTQVMYDLKTDKFLAKKDAGVNYVNIKSVSIENNNWISLRHHGLVLETFEGEWNDPYVTFRGDRYQEGLDKHGPFLVIHHERRSDFIDHAGNVLGVIEGGVRNHYLFQTYITPDLSYAITLESKELEGGKCRFQVRDLQKEFSLKEIVSAENIGKLFYGSNHRDSFHAVMAAATDPKLRQPLLNALAPEAEKVNHELIDRLVAQVESEQYELREDAFKAIMERIKTNDTTTVALVDALLRLADSNRGLHFRVVYLPFLAEAKPGLFTFGANFYEQHRNRALKFIKSLK